MIFPGQGSQYLGMGRELARENAVARQIFEQADDILGISLRKIAWEGPESELNDTINTQPALLTHSIAALGVFREMFPKSTPSFIAGHSMGEISALVAASALQFQDALLLARARGRFMKQAGVKSPGGMVAILGLDIPTVDKLCVECSTVNEIVQVANDNSPGQVVVSGSNSALDRIITCAQVAGARRVVRLAVSIAAHSPLMTHAQEGFSLEVQKTPISNPTIPVIGNVTASPLQRVEQIQADLQAQLTHRVRWTESIQTMIRAGVANFIEIGSGSVLIGLLKRIDRQATGISIGNPPDFSDLQSYLENQITSVN
jgi:[acyl-carrier-protein] S-malonyltransferase